jgi:hypothetical protein
MWTDYTNKRGYGLEIKDAPYDNNKIFTAMKNGEKISLNLSTHHTVDMNQAIRETLVRVNGRVMYDNFYFNIMDPAGNGSYRLLDQLEIDNAINIYFIRP